MMAEFQNVTLKLCTVQLHQVIFYFRWQITRKHNCCVTINDTHNN